MLSDDSSTTLRNQHQQEAQASSCASLSSSSSLPSFSSSSSLPSSVVFVPDLKPLRKAACFKALDPSKQICQYELPGGGVCRDEGCQEVHLSRRLDGASVDGIEPSGTLSLCSSYSFLWRWAGLCEFHTFFNPFSFAARCVQIFFLFLGGGLYNFLQRFNGLLVILPSSLFHPCFFAFLSFCSTDEDTAEYLFDVLSSANEDPSWLNQECRVTVGAIQGALQGLRGIGKVYEERVAEALATLQPPPRAM
jgi:hypothetical protein